MTSYLFCVRQFEHNAGPACVNGRIETDGHQVIARIFLRGLVHRNRKRRGLEQIGVRIQLRVQYFNFFRKRPLE